MIDYQRHNWWRICLTFYGSVLPAVLGRVGLLTGFSLVLYGLYVWVHRESGTMPAIDPLGHTVLGTALGLLIVFRTNAAYNRFWEARTLWGAVVNNSRNLVRSATVWAGPADELARLVVAYAVALREGLRGNRDLEPLLRPLLSGRLLERIAKVNNPPAALAKAMSAWIAARQAEGRLGPMEAMRLEALVCALTDAQGGCERIAKTPVPFVYSSLTKQMLILYLASLPFVLVPKMEYLAPLVVAVVSLGMLGIEEAGIEIEEPFGLEPNQLPLERICETIARDALDLSQQE
jgi:ion channel-forming bestrophin family protein